MELRPFQESDWPAIWRMFREVVEAGDTMAYDPEWSPEETRDMWVAGPPGHTVVACDGAQILGSATMGPNRSGRGSHIATASFMVDAVARGKGVGRALGAYALDWARQQGFAGMQFNAVVETNLPAVYLWQSLGFEIIGTVPEAFDHAERGRVGLHIMYRKL